MYYLLCTYKRRLNKKYIYILNIYAPTYVDTHIHAHVDRRINKKLIKIITQGAGE